jgi:hypothetical protein
MAAQRAPTRFDQDVCEQSARRSESTHHLEVPRALSILLLPHELPIRSRHYEPHKEGDVVLVGHDARRRGGSPIVDATTVAEGGSCWACLGAWRRSGRAESSTRAGPVDAVDVALSDPDERCARAEAAVAQTVSSTAKLGPGRSPFLRGRLRSPFVVLSSVSRDRPGRLHRDRTSDAVRARGAQGEAGADSAAETAETKTVRFFSVNA